MRVSASVSSDTAVLTTTHNPATHQLNNHIAGMGSVTNFAGKNGVPQQDRTMSPATQQQGLPNEWPGVSDGFSNPGTPQGNLSFNQTGNSQVVYAKPSMTTTMSNAAVTGTKQLTTLTTVNKIPQAPNSSLPPGTKPQVQITSTQQVRHAQPGAVQIPGISIPPGMVLARNHNGQLLLVNSNSLASSSTTTSAASVTQSATSGAVTTIKTSTATGATITQQAMATSGAVAAGQVVAQTVVPVANSITVKTVPAKQTGVGANKVASTSQAGAQQTSITLSQEDVVNVTKCRNFLTTLIKLASAGSQTQETVSNVKKLVQNLIDDKIEPEHFTKQLQIELNSAPQPYLVPFLKRSLPLLRLTMMQQSGTAGQVPPAIAVAAMRASSSSSPSPSTTPNTTKTVTLTKRPPPKTKVVGKLNSVPDIRLPRVATSPSPGVQLQRLAASPSPVVCRSSAAMPPPAPVTSSPRHPAQKWASPGGGGGGSGGGTFRDDDDINDVASMAGVNLSEESDRILATNSDLVGSQIRSCKDTTIVNAASLTRKLTDIVSRHPHVQRLHPDVINFTAHAVETRVKDLIEKVSLVAFHRIANYKDDEHYEASQDVKSQLKFLLELDVLEKKRHAQSEREVLMRAMKSRSKNEDPEQLRLKQKAKEMQQLEMERLQIRNADETARNAIGPRKKKPKLESSSIGLPDSKEFSSPFRSTTSRPRVKRVNVKDLVFVLEQERDTNKSKILYKSYLK